MRNNLVFTSLLLTLSLYGCNCPDSNIVFGHNYDDVIDKHIKFNQIFDFNEDYYFVYFYSLNCLHCELIKNEVIDFALTSSMETRFIQYYDEIPISDDVSETIGLDSVTKLAILGTPALLMVEYQKIGINVSGMDIIKNILKEYY